MAFCARAIPSARAFTRRFYDVISSVKHAQPYYYVKVNQEMRSDALVWLKYLDNFNGECYFGGPVILLSCLLIRLEI
jgi:hypothetical protein